MGHSFQVGGRRSRRIATTLNSPRKSELLNSSRMILKGQKRRLDPEDAEVSDRDSPLWESQRQFVFSVSLNKYQRGQELAEPSLRRSVLIANTLRQVALERCGAPPVDEEEPPPPPPSPPGGSFRLQAKERESRPRPASADPPASHRRSGDTEDQDEDWGSMSTDSDFSLSAAITSILTALDSTIDGGPQAAPRTPLRSLENLPGLSERGQAWVKHGTRAGGGGDPEPGCLNDVAMEDLFQDVETSLLERDMGGLGIRGSGAGRPSEEELVCCFPPFSASSSSSSSHSFSVSFNSNLKCLPSFSSFGPTESASFSGQNQAREGFELEHLMEILVES